MDVAARDLVSVILRCSEQPPLLFIIVLFAPLQQILSRIHIKVNLTEWQSNCEKFICPFKGHEVMDAQRLSIYNSRTM